MNQKDRILELVDKGIISAEEAVVLLEKMGEKASAKEQPTSSQLDSVMEGVASAFTKFSAKSDQTNDAIQVVLKRAKEIDRRIDEIRTAEQLDSLTVDEEMELVRLQEEAEQLNNQYKSLLQEKKQADAKVKAEKKQEWEESFKKANYFFMGCKICRLNCDSGGISHSKYRSEHALLRSQKRQKSTVSFPSSNR